MTSYPAQSADRRRCRRPMLRQQPPYIATQPGLIRTPIAGESPAKRRSSPSPRLYVIMRSTILNNFAYGLTHEHCLFSKFYPSVHRGRKWGQAFIDLWGASLCNPRVLVYCDTMFVQTILVVLVALQFESLLTLLICILQVNSYTNVDCKVYQ